MQIDQGVTLLRVEKARDDLYQVQRQFGALSHPKVLEQSRILDQLLNQYYRLNKKSSAH
ncbi:hypothetical protein DCC85_20685 [Paenibacillus sp. CAA11]|uniref:aspartyl-phosphate phosphatase Spo0E family protein n=1 Tax=Paenibacillus sp. CAA11 TaxID=1532905 RepID=UPI000D3C7AC0|nr:aspartyl-phosphate phosphatase Spo0E family protein [Paenibacillus sp. CAA11]AWB46343.1 hypothetical protein DCC85_20685 [Paenibacillus sp. CAA11]